jgi:hypothetical protein
MVFGQETNDWESRFPHRGGVRHLLDTYREFFISGYCYKRGGQFWNGVSRLRGAMCDRRSSSSAVGLIWNNLIKIGRAGEKGAPGESVLSWQDRWFDVVSFEVQALKPDVLVFFTGPNYDRWISRIFGDVTFEAVSDRPERQLARVKAKGLPFNAIRTYHPNYLWRNDFYSYLDDMMLALGG